MIVSSRLHFVFVHIPKTAGDAFAHAIKPHLHRADVLVENEFQGWCRMLTTGGDRQLYQLGKHATATDIQAVMSAERWESSFKVGFVRHPYTRAYSLYTYVARMAEERRRVRPRHLWYLTPPGRRGADPARWPGVRAYLENPSFSAFIRNPLIVGALGMKPQVEFLCDAEGNLAVDFVGSFEHLNADVQAVANRLQLGTLNLRERNSSGSRRSHPDLSTADRRYLAALFAADFEQFGFQVDYPS